MKLANWNGPVEIGLGSTNPTRQSLVLDWVGPGFYKLAVGLWAKMSQADSELAWVKVEHMPKPHLTYLNSLVIIYEFIVLFMFHIHAIHIFLLNYIY